MRHRHAGRKLGRTASHRKAMLKNMVTSLFAHERIKTTDEKAKEARRVAERMITFARRGDLSARRHVAKTVRDPDILKKLFDDIAPRYTERPGGYTRILKLGVRRGDGARTAMLELIGIDEEGRKKKKKQRKKYRKVEIPKSPIAIAREKADQEAKAAEEAAAEAEKAAEKQAEETAGAAESEEVAEAPAEEEKKEAAQKKGKKKASGEAEPGKKKKK